MELTDNILDLDNFDFKPEDFLNHNGSIGQASYLRHRLQKVARKTFPTLKDMLKGSSMIFVLQIYFLDVFGVYFEITYCMY